ncbi:enoyl-CoA hydratase/isomerase family protein [Tistrella bauzanensis]|uniref:3-hydroxyisobutyryl-CoA hydrolase n=1 Tax=Tistrella arctica TaxID=3133430 RepID=A0ABU9YF41_9PROT
MSDAQILFDRSGAAGIVTLNRPKALNALTLPMIRLMAPQMTAWAGDDSVGVIVVRGAPRPDGRPAFCAGGDVRALWDEREDPTSTLAAEFFGEEYTLNREIFRFPKPYVSLIDGVVMGGGVGLSVHGRWRVATENTLFAMPETAIGMLPDVGGTYILPRLPGLSGTYLALTGARLKAADCLALGIATHFVPAARLDALTTALAAIAPGAGADAAVEAVLGQFSDAGAAGTPGITQHLPVINACFAGDDMAGILDRLQTEGGEWGQAVARELAHKSPTSMVVALRQMRVGGNLSFEDCMTTEFRVATRIVRSHDFAEGIRSVLVDKDHNPKWSPERVQDVDSATIDALFAPLGKRDLTFA